MRSQGNRHVLLVEILLVSICCVVVFFISSKIDLLEKIVAFSAKHEDLELDEIISVLIFLVFAIGFLLCRKIIFLKKALKEINQLEGLIPICSNCKDIRDDKGYWQRVEGYIQSNSGATFSHGVCPDCFEKLYPELMDNPTIAEELKRQEKPSVEQRSQNPAD